MPHERVRARDLLTRAAEQYHAPGSPLHAAAAAAAFGGFASGAQWMRLVLETMRGRPCSGCSSTVWRPGWRCYGP
jgi:hypothetical protein